MSVEQANAFLAKLRQDPETMAALKREASTLDAALPGLVAAGAAAGFSFTAGELKSLLEALSDDELDAVAGGGLKDLWDW